MTQMLAKSMTGLSVGKSVGFQKDKLRTKKFWAFLQLFANILSSQIFSSN